MSDFEKAVIRVLSNEGGYTDHPDDPGGATNYGITLPVLREDGIFGDINNDGDIDVEDIKSLSIDQAKDIYKRQWWDRYEYWQIADQMIATKILDLSVNMGPRQAHLVAQRALRSIGHPIKEDGILGPITKLTINQADPLFLMFAMRSEAAGVYRAIVAKNPTLKVFLAGWLNRAYQ